MAGYFDDLDPAQMSELTKKAAWAQSAAMAGCPLHQGRNRLHVVQYATELGLLSVAMNSQHSEEPLGLLEYANFAALLGYYVGQCEKVWAGAVSAANFCVAPGPHCQAVYDLMEYAARGFELFSSQLAYPDDVGTPVSPELWLCRKDDLVTQEALKTMTQLGDQGEEYHRVRCELCGISPDLTAVFYEELLDIHDEVTSDEDEFGLPRYRRRGYNHLSQCPLGPHSHTHNEVLNVPKEM